MMQKLVFPMRESMPYFVCSLRQVDEWKRIRAQQSHVFTQAAYDINAKYIKSPFAKSLKIEDILCFLDDTALDIEFMVQLPSIEKCLDQWWKVYAKDKPFVDADALRQVYYDLANVLVQAKTENTHKNSVSMIMRASWTKWSSKEVPLSQPEFFRLMFGLAHLMTDSNRLGDYVTFFQETLAKITRASQAKAKRTEQRKRKPRVIRKSSIVEIMGKSGNVVRMRTASMVSRGTVNQTEDLVTATGIRENGGEDGSAMSSPRHGIVNVTLRRVLTLQSSGLVGLPDFDDASHDRFVEVLDRRNVYAQKGTAQHVVIDPLVFDRRFQDKWRHPAHTQTLSTEDALREFHPLSNKYVPPLSIARLHTSPLPLEKTEGGLRGLSEHHCISTPALKLKDTRSKEINLDAELKAASGARDEREDEVLRRSLSAVTLKSRIEHNKGLAKLSSGKTQPTSTKREDYESSAPVYLAIST